MLPVLNASIALCIRSSHTHFCEHQGVEEQAQTLEKPSGARGSSLFKPGQKVLKPASHELAAPRRLSILPKAGKSSKSSSSSSALPQRGITTHLRTGAATSESQDSSSQPS